MAQNIDAITTATLALALDAASLRQQAIAANIANHATEGYVPVKLDFAAQMEDLRRGVNSAGAVDPAALAAVSLRLQPVLDANGQPAKVHLDAEMADMAQNSLHFQALAKALNKHMAILSTAVTEGKR
jgi:flagellar basal-body rod protein FlgB